MEPPDRVSPTVTVAVTLAALLAWQCVALVLDVDAAATKFRVADSVAPTTARWIVVVAALVGLVASGLLLVPRTRAAGGALAATGLLLLAGYLAVVWIRGDPVQCLCGPGSRPRGSLAHMSSILLLAASGVLAGGVARASRRHGTRRVVTAGRSEG